MKSFISVLVWTILFISLGIFINIKTSDFTHKYSKGIEIIENYIEEDNLEKAKESLVKYSDDWHKENKLWYLLLNHENFDSICLYLNILDKSILVNDKSKCLEYIEKIKSTLSNILENEKCDLSHIM